jgi:hypothetical protein
MFSYLCLFFVVFSSSLIANKNEIPKDLQAAKYVTVIEKNDGFGFQLFRRMSAIAFAKFHGKVYIHLPFTEIAHNYDNDINFPKKMETFANIGMGCLLRENIYKDLMYYGGSYWGYYISLATDIGRKLKEKEERKKLDNIDMHRRRRPEKIGYRRFERLSREEFDLLLSENLNHPYIYAREDYVYYTNKDVNAYFNKDVLDLLRKRFHSSQKENIPYFEKDRINVAVHIRRGDILICNRGRAFKDEYFLDIIENIRKMYPMAVFHIFSEGDEEEFIKFRSKDIKLHINEDLAMTFHAMVAADILVASQSTLSYTASILSKGIIYSPKWRYPKLEHWIEMEYTQGIWDKKF